MIYLPNSVKDEYKDFNREIEVFGNLYLGQERVSHNLFNAKNFLSGNNDIYTFTKTNYYYNDLPTVPIETYNLMTDVDYIFSYKILGNSNLSNAFLSVIGYDANNQYIYETSSENANIVLGTSVCKFRLPSTTAKITLRFNRNYVATTNTISTTDIQIYPGTEIKDYEPYGEKVIDYGTGTTNNLFNINEIVILPYDVLKQLGDSIYCVNTQNQLGMVGHVRLMNLAQYKNKYVTISLNMNTDTGYCELKRGTDTTANNSYVITWSLKNKYTFLVPNDLENNEYLWITPIIPPNTSVYITNIMINEGKSALPYEKYNTPAFKLTEANNCKILGFNINQKADVYYTSLPYNTMTLEVDNEQGYFTDYDEDSIIEQLNEDCYIDLFMRINSGDYYKIMTMNYDKISYSDYEKAKLSFYSNLARIEKYTLKDKNNAFSQWVQQYSLLKDWFEDNYDITMYSDHPDLVNDTTITINDDLTSSNLKDYLLSNATYELGQTRHAEVLLTNNYMNWLTYKAITNVVSETIPTDLQLERPIIKKEDTYKGVKYNWYSDDWQYEATSETYSKTLRGTLQSTSDTIIIVDYDYRLSDITINDIIASSNVSVSVEQMNSLYSEAKTLRIQGNIGEMYDISINKSNMYKRIRNDLVTWPLGDTTDTSKILEVRDEAPIESSMYVFLFIKKPIKSKVEIKIMGLPYLEIGDTINVELENRIVKFFITEIETSYSDGLIQTIKGYELDWTHQVSGNYSDLNDWT